MKESPQVLEWQREARAEARAEARLETGKEYVQRAVCVRLGTSLPADLQDRLAAIQSVAELDRWFEASLTSPSLDIFRAAVANGKRRRKCSP